MLLPKREAPRLIELARSQGNVFRVSRPWRIRYLALAVATPVIFVVIPLPYLTFDGIDRFLFVGLMAFLSLGLGGTFAAVALRGLVAVSTEGLAIRTMGTQVFSWEDEELFIGGLPGGFGGEAALTLVNPSRRIPRQLAIGRFDRPDELMGAIEAASLAFTQGTATSSTLRPAEDQARYSEVMTAARRSFERGEALILNAGTQGVYVFYNNPELFSYTYMIPGNWIESDDSDAFVSPDGTVRVAVSIIPGAEIDRSDGAGLLEAAAADHAGQFEEALHTRLEGVTLDPVDWGRPGVWLWSAGPVAQADLTLRLDPSAFVDLSPIEAVAQVTVSGDENDLALTRSIVGTIQATTAPEGFWPLLEELSSIMSEGGRSEVGLQGAASGI